MARDRSPITKQSRREGYALHPKAHKIMVKRSTPPGQHSHARQGKKSQYAMQLREKQKVRRIYGLLEKQFVKLMKKSSAQQGQAGENLIINLERRLDNVIYRAGFSVSRRAARQLVNHGHFNLNGRRVNIPSIEVNPGDVIELREKSKKNAYFTSYDDTIADLVEDQNLSWLVSDKKKFTVKITGLPKREEAGPDIQEQLIVEFYSR